MTGQDSDSSKDASPVVNRIGLPESVPVYNCIVYLSPKDQDGQVSCRCANLEGLTVVAATERDALQAIVRAFKERAAQAQEAGAPIQLIDPPPEPDEGESIRYLAVHL